MKNILYADKKEYLNKMPNWIVHLAAVRIFPKKRVETGFRYLLLGAVLPDIARINVIFVNFLKLETIPIAFFGAFHTPFMMAIIALAIGFLTKRPRRVFCMVFLGAVLHLVCDMLKPGAGSRILMLYPFNYKEFSLPIPVESYRWISYIISFLSFCILFHLYSYLKSKERIPFSKKKAYISLILFFISIAISYATIPAFLINNVGFSQFIRNPAKFEGKEVILSVDKVISVKPPKIFVRKGKAFELVTQESLKIGQWVSIRGIYQKGLIKVNKIYYDVSPQEKSILSCVGLIFLFIVFKNRACFTDDA